MQINAMTRPNHERTQATQAALMTAARQLFLEKGYANTSTPEIVATANVTRGALYHHYADKAELFFAVARQAADEVAAEIARESAVAVTPQTALMLGAEAYFSAMAQDGRARLLLLEAPAVLGTEKVLELAERTGSSELADGLAHAMHARDLADLGDDAFQALAALLSAAFDRAAIATARGEPTEPYYQAMRFLLNKVT
jgi:AcrR family transcriptional regulator